jgi:hypothetical protein
MALANGDVVAPHLESGTVKAQPQPPTFGVVDDAAGVDVLWQDGSLQTAITAVSLDKLGTPTGDNLSGQRVMVDVSPGSSFQASADYQGVVVDLYTRDPAGSGSPGADLALVKLLSSGLYLEVLASQCTVVAGGA